MNEPKEDPIEELLQFHDVQGALPDDELGRRLQAALNKAFPAIQGLRERNGKLGMTLLMEAGQISYQQRIDTLESKLARVIEAGDAMADAIEDQGVKASLREISFELAWRKAVSE